MANKFPFGQIIKENDGDRKELEQLYNKLVEHSPYSDAYLVARIYAGNTSTRKAFVMNLREWHQIYCKEDK